MNRVDKIINRLAQPWNFTPLGAIVLSLSVIGFCALLVVVFR